MFAGFVGPLDAFTQLLVDRLIAFCSMSPGTTGVQEIVAILVPALSIDSVGMGGS